MRQSCSPSTHPSSVLKSPYVSFFDNFGVEKMFNCGCSIDDVDTAESVATMYKQVTSYEDDNTNSSTQTIRRKNQLNTTQEVSSYDDTDDDHDDHHDVTQTESAKEYFNRIKKLSINISNSQETQDQLSQSQSQMAIPTSPITTQKQQQQQCQSTPIKSNKSPKSKMLPKLPHYEMFKIVLPSYRSKDRYPLSSGLKHTDSTSTQSTQSMSDDSDNDDDISSFDSRDQKNEEEEQQPVSILRRKVKLGTILGVRNYKRYNNVRFEKGTTFPDPNEIPSPTRKKVPRLTQRQKQEYQMNNYNSYYYDTAVMNHIRPQKQLNLSSLLMAAGPSLVISTHNNDEFRDYSTPSSPPSSPNMMSHQESELRRQQRLARRAEQKQYQYSNNHRRRNTTSTSAAEALLSQYYNEESTSFYAFR